MASHLPFGHEAEIFFFKYMYIHVPSTIEYILMPWQTKCGLAYFDTQKKIKSFLILMCTNCLVQTLKYTETLMAEKNQRTELI